MNYLLYYLKEQKWYGTLIVMWSKVISKLNSTINNTPIKVYNFIFILK